MLRSKLFISYFARCHLYSIIPISRFKGRVYSRCLCDGDAYYIIIAWFHVRDSSSSSCWDRWDPRCIFCFSFLRKARNCNNKKERESISKRGGYTTVIMLIFVASLLLQPPELYTWFFVFVVEISYIFRDCLICTVKHQIYITIILAL